MHHSTEMRCDHVEKSYGISKKSNEPDVPGQGDLQTIEHRLAEKMDWLGSEPHSIRHILITHQNSPGALTALGDVQMRYFEFILTSKALFLFTEEKNCDEV